MKTLEQIRKDRGVSKVAVQRHLGVSQPTYDKYEAHPETMSVENFEKVCAFLHVRREDIFLPVQVS